MNGTGGRRVLLAVAIWQCGAGACRADVPQWIERLIIWAQPEIRELEREVERIDGELAGLPTPAGTSSGARRGFQTSGAREDEELWVDLELAEAAELDQVVLVPLLAKGSHGQVPGYGFPKRFQLEVRDVEGEVHVLMDETGADFPNPGIYPVLADCPAGVRISGVRLTATDAGAGGVRPVLALAEMLALSGNRNLAPGGRVTASSSRELAPTWGRANLTDMETALGLPLLPVRGTSLTGWHSDVSADRETEERVTVDLGRRVGIGEIRIVSAWRRRTPVWSQYGFPSRFLVEAAASEDFSDARVIRDQRDRTLQSPGQNLLCHEVGGDPIRYVRMTATRLRETSGEYFFALGELQAYHGNENVALGARVIAEESLEDAEWGRAGLTDGMAGGGRMMELPEWFRGLERRRQLEDRRSAVTERRAEMLDRGERILVLGSVGTTCGVAALAVMVSWRAKRQRRIDREHHREKLARDLHDELGSNLGSIALISSFALEGESDEETMRADFAEIEAVARESADSMREMVEMLGGGRGGASSDWLGVMERLAKRLLRGVDLDCRLPDGPVAPQPDLETRREIYLFCKEVLHNVVRHAGATKVGFYLRAKLDGLCIEITDNGCGFDPERVGSGHGLGNLRERAAGLRATMDLASAPGGPTTVKLDVPRGKRWRKSREREIP